MSRVQDHQPQSDVGRGMQRPAELVLATIAASSAVIALAIAGLPSEQLAELGVPDAVQRPVATAFLVTALVDLALIEVWRAGLKRWRRNSDG